MPLASSAFRLHAIFGLAVAVTSVFFVDWCAVVFDCGCRSLLLGGAAACNIHLAAGPHCPWCAHPLAGGGVAFLATLGAQFLAVYRSGAAPAVLKLGLALAAMPLVSGLIGWGQGWWWGYWAR